MYHEGDQQGSNSMDAFFSSGGVIDLNTFSFFYSNEPAVQSLFASFPCLHVCPLYVADQTYEGTAWTGAIGPENIAGVAGGFFVSRPFLLPAAVPLCDRLEVLHVHTQWAGPEVGVSWFFHTIGSGIFLNCHDLPVSGAIAAYRNRLSVTRSGNDDDHTDDDDTDDDDTDEDDDGWPGDGSPRLAEWMDARGLAMLVITEADYSNDYGDEQRGGNPRTEIIVRQREGANEAEEPARSCLTDAPFGFRWTTGIEGRRPCVCSPSDKLNCDG